MDVGGTTLDDLGWRSFFSAQVLEDEAQSCQPVRVMAVYRGLVTVMGEGVDGLISSRLPDLRGGAPRDEEDRAAAGDWLMMDKERREPIRILKRENLFKRPSPANERKLQLIAANVDTLFIVTSCNQDFNIPRLERYLVLAREVGVHPVIILTKIDKTDDLGAFLNKAQALQEGLTVIPVNARDPHSVAALANYCRVGQTVTLMGSSGVGKSTLINTMRGSDAIATQPVREQDDKGRHTTTVREMHRLAQGGWLMDTPGMREFQISDATTGLAEVFDDIVALALECRFTNCSHEAEPGCAIQNAMQEGALTPQRLARWQKLQAEDTMNTGTPLERRARVRRGGKRK